MAIRQLTILLIISVVLGLGVNLVSPNSIAVIGKYRSLSSGTEPIIPPNADVDDPPFIALDLAELEFNSGNVVFIDCREPEEFECGTIPGAINIPFDYLPEDNLEAHIDSALGHCARDTKLITFCSGEECDLSLHMARNLQAFGYTNLGIFFGGSREWVAFDLKLERRRNCEE
ncbi:MAG: rhodanese-like domain-containing protein [candidate division Zixibacteria bacterium]|nr:rhodanese-like domain-containing protein [candidate division Zixibacteria bacterium]